MRVKVDQVYADFNIYLPFYILFYAAIYQVLVKVLQRYGKKSLKEQHIAKFASHMLSIPFELFGGAVLSWLILGRALLLLAMQGPIDFNDWGFQICAGTVPHNKRHLCFHDDVYRRDPAHSWYTIFHLLAPFK
jgi:hypothetical protein